MRNYTVFTFINGTSPPQREVVRARSPRDACAIVLLRCGRIPVARCHGETYFRRGKSIIRAHSLADLERTIVPD